MDWLRITFVLFCIYFGKNNLKMIPLRLKAINSSNTYGTWYITLNLWVLEIIVTGTVYLCRHQFLCWHHNSRYLGSYPMIEGFTSFKKVLLGWSLLVLDIFEFILLVLPGSIYCTIEDIWDIYWYQHFSYFTKFFVKDKLFSYLLLIGNNIKVKIFSTINVPGKIFFNEKAVDVIQNLILND